jgi:hypothetical protein
MSTLDPRLRAELPSVAEEVERVLGDVAVFARYRRGAPAEEQLRNAIERFEPLDMPAARAAADWLRTRDLSTRQESVPYLMVRGGQLLGFYALSNGVVRLTEEQEGEYGVRYRVQPAAHVTWLARDRRFPGVGHELLLHAVGTARRLASWTAATMLVLDAFDDETYVMWQDRYGFRPSGQRVHGGRPRLFVALPDD